MSSGCVDERVSSGCVNEPWSERLSWSSTHSFQKFLIHSVVNAFLFQKDYERTLDSCEPKKKSLQWIERALFYL